VAVVQISRLQVRRGQKNQGSGLPQLASGEIGWAIDTRELYIGNGAVSEGAPAVGNTKVLTEYDDILNLADTYTYKANDAYIVTGVNSSNPITRTLQERLDDRVSVRSFGAVGDGVVDDTVAIQRAIDQLYLNSATKSAYGASPQSRVVLHLEAGTYIISDTIYLPPYASLVGAGSAKTIIYQSVNKPAFITVNASSTVGTPASDSASTSTNQAREILMQGMTIQSTQSGEAGANNISSDPGSPASAKGIILQSCKDSKFVDLNFEGVWTSGTTYNNDAAVVLNSLSGAVESSNNIFENCKFYGYSSAVRSDWDIDNNTWSECNFELLGYGVVFGEAISGLTSTALGQSTGPVNNRIEKSKFYDISHNAVWINAGRKNVSDSNSFELVGTNSKNEDAPLFPVIRYETVSAPDNYSLDNKSFNDYFARTAILSNGTSTAPYYAEVAGAAVYSLDYENRKDFGRVTGVNLIRLPGLSNQSYDIDYTMVSKNYEVIRSGILHVVVDAYNDQVELSDDFHFVGDESYLDAVELTAIISVIPVPATGATNETIDIKVTSSMPVDDTTEFKYTIKAKTTEYS